MESILNSIKKALGIEPDYNHFDPELIMHINSVFSTLYQLGVGPKEAAYHITDSSDTWDDFLSGKIDIDSVKTYVYLKVRVIFDPPQSYALESFKQQIQELEWRLNVADDNT